MSGCQSECEWLFSLSFYLWAGFGIVNWKSFWYGNILETSEATNSDVFVQNVMSQILMGIYTHKPDTEFRS